MLYSVAISIIDFFSAINSNAILAFNFAS